MVRAFNSLIPVLLTCVPAAAAAQQADPVDIVDAAARERGDLSQVLVLGTSHLSSLPQDFDRSSFDALLDRLERWAPEKIAVEGLSGPQCDYLRAYAFAYPETAEGYCPDVAPARQALGLDGAQAEQEALALLDQESLSAQDHRRLAALFLAMGEPDSALLHFLAMPADERIAGGELTQDLVTALESRSTQMSENLLIAVALGQRLGHRRIYPVDDHTGDRATGPVDDALFGAEISAAWDNEATARRREDYERWESGVVDGTVPVIDWHRAINSPEQVAQIMRSDFAAAAGARHPGMSGRKYLAYWETRNLRMIANLREVIGAQGRVLALVGVSHRPYYDRYLGMTSDVELADLDAVLAE